MGYQCVVILGNVTKDPELKTVGEYEVAKFSVAVNGAKDAVEFFDCEWWKPNGALGFMGRGTPVLCQGEIQTQKWEKDGQPRSKQVLKIRTVQLTGAKQKKADPVEEEFADFR
jgi:single-stranded DNA-binding protein